MLRFVFDLNFDDITDNRVIVSHNYIILHADNILLVSCSLSDLQNLLFVCERKLL